MARKAEKATIALLNATPTMYKTHTVKTQRNNNLLQILLLKMAEKLS